MALVTGRNGKVYVAGYDLSGLTNRYNVNMNRSLKDVTTFNDTGRKRKPVIHDDSFDFDGFFETATIHTIMNTLRTQTTVAVCSLCAGATLSSTAFGGNGSFQDGYSLDIAVDDLIRLRGEFKVSGLFRTGFILQANAEQTEDDSGTGVDCVASCIHVAPDTSQTITADDADTPAKAYTLLNEIKADYNTHRASTTYHVVADGTNIVAAANADTEAKAVTLSNEIKADYNLHRSQTGVHQRTDGTNVVTSTDATAFASVYTLANEIKADFNAHLTAPSYSGCEANLHVFACDVPDLVIKVQDDDNTDFSSPTDRITFTTVTGVTSERKVTTSTVQRFVRVTWSGTWTGSKTATFAVIFSRL